MHQLLQYGVRYAIDPFQHQYAALAFNDGAVSVYNCHNSNRVPVANPPPDLLEDSYLSSNIPVGSPQAFLVAAPGKHQDPQNDLKINQKYQFPLIAASYDSGHVLLIQGNSTYSLFKDHFTPANFVTAFCITPDLFHLYAATKSGSIMLYTSKNHESFDRPVVISNAFQNELGLSAICLAPDLLSLAIATSSTLVLMDIKSGTILRRYNGHPAPIYQIKFVDHYILTSCITDPYIALWDAFVPSSAASSHLESKKAKKMKKLDAKNYVHSSIASFMAHDIPRCLDLIKSIDSDSFSIIAVTKDGKLDLWKDRSLGTKKSNKSIPSSFSSSSTSIYPDLSVVPSEQNSNDQIHDAIWLKDDTILAIYGNHSKPTFKTIPVGLDHLPNLQNSNNQIILPPSGLINSVLVQTDVISANNVNKSHENKDIHVIGPTDMPRLGGEPLSISNENKKATLDKDSDTDDDEGEDDELTMEEKLLRLGVSNRSAPNFDRPSLVPFKESSQEKSRQEQDALLGPSVVSSAAILIQSLQTKDNHLLDRVFELNKFRSIQETVQAIPTELVVDFLDRIADYFLSRYAEVGNLSLWLRCVLFEHIGILYSNPRAKKILYKLQNAMNDRMTNHQRWVALESRLTLLNTQAQKRASTPYLDLANQEPLVLYTETTAQNEDESPEEESKNEMDGRDNDRMEEEFDMDDFGSDLNDF